MKKFTSLLIACSLALAGAAMAQQPDQTPKEKKRAPEKTHAAEAKPGANAPKPEATAARPHGARNERAGSKTQNAETTPKSELAASATPGAKPQAGQRRKGNAAAENAKTSPASASVTPPFSAAGQQNARAKGTGAAKKPEPQQVQQIRAQHTSFHAQPKPQQVPPVTFSQSYRIQGSERWQGPQYEVFRSYRPERHEEGWYRSHYSRVELIGGGYYYWNSGYWYPAWGYSPSAEYYAYDGPIYVGQRAEPPDQVIADVQAELQQMGYYKGEVDGLLGPMTREALTAYQADQGLTTTAAIDEPTLDSLGLS